MTNRVEIAFDLSNDPNANFAVLNDPVRGILGSPTYVLGGQLLIDVTDKVLSYSITRGKSRQLDRYPAGRCEVFLDNNDREFDPLFESGPYFGQIIPKRAVRIISDNIVQYLGLIDDWNLDYAPRGNSIASIIASDGLTKLANQSITEVAMTSEYSGERVATVLSLPDVAWPADQRNIEQGQTILQADTIPDNTNALSYLQKVTETEPGSLFVSKTGDLTFKDRAVDSSPAEIILFDDAGSGIPYTELAVIYGSELLYNEIIVSRLGGGTAIASSISSQNTYGIFNLTLTDLLMNTDEAAQELADYLIGKYAQPEYRFEALTIDLSNLTTAQKADVFALELGDYVQIAFTPNQIPPQITQYAEIIGIRHSVTATTHLITFGFAGFENTFFQLDDPVFGRLDEGNVLGAAYNPWIIGDEIYGRLSAGMALS